MKIEKIEGDLVCAAEKVTPDIINFMVTEGRGLICVTLTSERTHELQLSQMVQNNTESHGCAFTVSVDAEANLEQLRASLQMTGQQQSELP